MPRWDINNKSVHEREAGEIFCGKTLKTSAQIITATGVVV